MIGKGNIAERIYTKYVFNDNTSPNKNIKPDCKIKFGIELKGYLANLFHDHLTLKVKMVWVVYAIGIPIIKAIMNGKSIVLPSNFVDQSID